MRPVAQALRAHGVTPTLIFTGQHQLAPAEFGLDGYPLAMLACPGERDPHAHVKTVTQAMIPLLADGPDLLMVQGDTSSALGGALAASAAGIPVAHVEAGLRTHDPLLPWPEEEYRTAIDADAALLFAPTEISAANLEAERVSGEILVTGNTSVDALLEAERLLPPRPPRPSKRQRILVTCHRRESWDGGLHSVAAALVELANAGAVIDFVVHPNGFVAGEMRRLLGGCRGITMVPACGHHELLQRMRSADLLLSDSGGIQEEAPTFGLHVLITRETTERPEVVEAGFGRLVGSDHDRIVAGVRALTAADQPQWRSGSNPFGAGDSGEQIAAALCSALGTIPGRVRRALGAQP
jgi:UDP-N-acetylglucosamine 2-epimerase (non-hydrolysing)